MSGFWFDGNSRWIRSWNLGMTLTQLLEDVYAVMCFLDQCLYARWKYWCCAQKVRVQFRQAYLQANDTQPNRLTSSLYLQCHCTCMATTVILWIVSLNAPQSILHELVLNFINKAAAVFVRNWFSLLSQPCPRLARLTQYITSVPSAIFRFLYAEINQLDKVYSNSCKILS